MDGKMAKGIGIDAKPFEMVIPDQSNKLNSLSQLTGVKTENFTNQANRYCTTVVPVIFIGGENDASLPNKKRIRARRRKGSNMITAIETENEVDDKLDVKRIKIEVSVPSNDMSVQIQDLGLNNSANPFSISSEMASAFGKKKKKRKRKKKNKGAGTEEVKFGEEHESSGNVNLEPNKNDAQPAQKKLKKKKKRRSKRGIQSTENNESNRVLQVLESKNEGGPANGSDITLTIKSNSISNSELMTSASEKQISEINLGKNINVRKKRKRIRSNKKKKAHSNVSIEEVEKVSAAPEDLSVTQISNLSESMKPTSVCSENASAVGKNNKKKRKRKKRKGAGAGVAKQDIGEEAAALSVSLLVNEKELQFVNEEQPAKKKRKWRKKRKSAVDNQSQKLLNTEVMTATSAKLNNIYSDESNKDEITKYWTYGSLLRKDNGFQLLGKPFRFCYMPDFLKDSCFLEKLKEELSDIDLVMKNNDLYKFRQTSDLKNVSSPYIRSLREYLYGDFRRWLSDVTGIELNGTVDMGSSRYEYTDVLLCHDDELEGRRVAYILYLVPPWNENDGGTLDLFNVDQNGKPQDIVKSLQPKWNTFAFFEVCPVSFHQVHEVLSQDKVRISINGWFHGPNIERPPKYVEPPRPLLSPVHIDQDELYSWINPSYLDMDTQGFIRKKFQNDSEIALESFFCNEKYEELTDALQSCHLTWLETGPADKQLCKILKQEQLPDIINSCCKFLQSEACFLILSQLTGLKLHHLAPPDSDPDEEEEESKNSCPGMTLDIRKWSHGCYTLLRDGDQDKSSTLDAMLYLHADEWSLEHGGFTNYIVKDEDKELLTVIPRSNCFALVYRDAESLRFTKYINANVQDLGIQDSFFYDFSCTYKE